MRASCDNCGQAERRAFASNLDFDQLDRRFRVAPTFLKVGEVEAVPREPRFRLFGRIGWMTKREAVPFHTLWKCTECSQVWMLSEPDMAWRGFFLRVE